MGSLDFRFGTELQDIDAIRLSISVRLAVPENPFGLTLILRIFDRCGKTAPPYSATGSGGAVFPS